MRILLSFVSTLLTAASLFAGYGNLTFSAPSDTASLIIKDGEILTVIGKMVNPPPYASSGSSSVGAPVVVSISYEDNTVVETYISRLEDGLVLVGPVMLDFHFDEEIVTSFSDNSDLWQYSAIFSYRIDSALDKESANVVTLPIISSGSWSVLLETSSDLKEWSAATPGLFAPADGVQFFRLRVVREDY